MAHMSSPSIQFLLRLLALVNQHAAFHTQQGSRYFFVCLVSCWNLCWAKFYSCSLWETQGAVCLEALIQQGAEVCAPSLWVVKHLQE